MISIVVQIRKLQNISQAELAKKTGVNQSSIARWEAGIPAIADEYISKTCEILSIKKSFLDGKTDYPFKHAAFIKFFIKGLSYRLHPFAWLEMLLQYSDLKILLLLREDTDKVIAACVQDDHGSIFLISIEIPLTWKDFFDFQNQYSTKGTHKALITTKHFFSAKGTLGLYHFFNDIVKFSRDDIARKIEEAFSDVLSDEEKKLIAFTRENKIPADIMTKLSSDSIEKIQNNITKWLEEWEKEKKFTEKFRKEFKGVNNFTEEYVLSAKREQKKIHGRDGILVKVPVGVVLKDLLVYLRNGDDIDFKASSIKELVAFYRAHILKDFSEKNHENDLKIALKNFHIPRKDK